MGLWLSVACLLREPYLVCRVGQMRRADVRANTRSVSQPCWTRCTVRRAAVFVLPWRSREAVSSHDGFSAGTMW